MPKKKKPRRNGVPVQSYLSPPTFDALEAYRAKIRAEQGFTISKTDIIEQALIEYLTERECPPKDSDA